MTRMPSLVSGAGVAVGGAGAAASRVHRSRTASGAPDTARMMPSPAWQARETSLRAGSNGNTAISSPPGVMPSPAAARASSVSIGSRPRGDVHDGGTGEQPGDRARRPLQGAGGPGGGQRGKPGPDDTAGAVGHSDTAPPPPAWPGPDHP